MAAAIKDKIAKHLEIQASQKDTQNGFTKGRFCLSNVPEFLESVNKQVDKSDSVGIICIDLFSMILVAMNKIKYKILKGQVLFRISN